MNDDNNFKEYLIVEKNSDHKNELNSRIKAFQDWGYSEHNTSSMQITDEEFPEIFEPFKKFAGFGKTKPAVIFIPGVYFNNVKDGSKSGQAVDETDTGGGRGLRPSQAIDGGSESEPTWPVFLAGALVVALIVLKTKQ